MICPFCGERGLPLPTGLSWHKKCPNCGAEYWINHKGTFESSVRSLLFTYFAINPRDSSTTLIKQMKNHGLIRGTEVDNHSVIFAQFSTLRWQQLFKHFRLILLKVNRVLKK